MLRFLDAGESHGPAQVAIVEGIPAGLPLTATYIQIELDKRRFGSGRGGRAKIETDQVEILTGVRFGTTLGSPIALMVRNLDFANWQGKMNIADIDVEKGPLQIHNPRPGHADLTGVIKYHFDDVQNVLERASARETIMRVAVGAVAKKLLGRFGIEIASHTIQIGTVKLNRQASSFQEIQQAPVISPDIRCIDKQIAVQMEKAIMDARVKKDTLGGVIEIVGHNIPAGLGSYVHFDRRLDGRIAQALMSIQSVKAVEIGQGVENASKFGSTIHDEIYYRAQGPALYYRKTNRAGGIEGGMSNGEDIICLVYHKPISTLGQPLKTVDIRTHRETNALIERSDVCVIPRAGVISEAAIALVIADAFLEKFGCDSIDEINHNFEGYMKRISTI